ncbi:Papain family cysteine protease [Carpediemonas membranifera]|uniref:Papain family cysteine protease n=1 Tax=Carpediemonas membranifera TaxID=201153 RepID=A0A8J6E114_9EUKA|nr:Papain family cysteine protease [Carpediemonas membranifera]|eukprot:KAG9392531.1 Papain family cysteine protease [Carpediemonas membranifera]
MSRLSIELLGAVEALPAEQLGDSLDWRELEPHCLDYVLNQGQCGSCWAFGSSTALSDRFCIKTGKKSLLSPQDLVACDFAGQLGCHGGYPKRAYEYLEFFGSPSLACFPYTSGVTKVAGHCHHYCADGTAHPHRYYAQKFKSRSCKGANST